MATCSSTTGSGMAALAPVALLLAAALLGAAAVGTAPAFSCGAASAEATLGLTFCDASLSPVRRAADLVSRMTPAEKVAQLGDVAPAMPRLGVPGYKWWNEALHGLANSGKGLHFDAVGGVRAATSFPKVLLAAAAFDDGLWLCIGQRQPREIEHHDAALQDFHYIDVATSLWTTQCLLIRHAYRRAPGSNTALATLHSHPRGTELLFVVDGSLACGFISATLNRVYAKTLRKGELMVVPQGQLHFQYSLGNTTAVTLSSYNSANPGLQVLDYALFANDLPTEVVSNVTNLEELQVSKLKALFGGSG